MNPVNAFPGVDDVAAVSIQKPGYCWPVRSKLAPAGSKYQLKKLVASVAEV